MHNDADIDVMQVCRNGHVITDRLRSDPQSGRFHCERCGASTLDRCLTCGHELPGAGRVVGLIPIGAWPAPRQCPTCGAAFPWAPRPRAVPQPFVTLESFLRRLPLVIRQLRWRQSDRPPYRIDDERDLEDLVRSLLPLYFDDVRLECRTPCYSARTRTDFLLPAEGIALTVKQTLPTIGEAQLLAQAEEDVAYYRKTREVPVLVCFVHDAEQRLRETPARGNMAASERVAPALHWVISS